MAGRQHKRIPASSVIEQLARAAGTVKDDGSVHAASFAELTGVTAATISRLLHGKIEDMSPRTVSKLVQVFGVSPAQVQGFEALPEQLAVKAAAPRDIGADVVLDELRMLRRDVQAALGTRGQSETAAELTALIAQLDEHAQRRMLALARAELESR